MTESGKLHALAVGTEERLPDVDTPILVELGYPELTRSTTTFCVVASAGRPDGVVEKLEGTLRGAWQDPIAVEELDERHLDELLGREELERLLASAVTPQRTTRSQE